MRSNAMMISVWRGGSALICAVATLFVLNAAGSAQAASVSFKLASVAVDLDNHAGLKLFADTSVLNKHTFSLDDGESVRVAAFRLGTHERQVNFDDKFIQSLNVTFTFSLPGGVMSTVQGFAFGVDRSCKDDFVVFKGGRSDVVSTPAGLFSVSLGKISSKSRPTIEFTTRCSAISNCLAEKATRPSPSSASA